MYNHLVLFRFESFTSDEQKKEAILRLLSLKDSIPGIEDLKAGHNFSERNKGYDIGLSVILTNKLALEEYGPHPKHQEVVSYLNKIGLIDLIIIDFEI